MLARLMPVILAAVICGCGGGTTSIVKEDVAKVDTGPDLALIDSLGELLDDGV